ncbi:hypothetical protein HN859_05615 [Candidatus Parcubacteria bacterium]|nr:hypothetical protein [Candidatus Parcubacteria bacterium]
MSTHDNADFLVIWHELSTIGSKVIGSKECFVEGGKTGLEEHLREFKKSGGYDRVVQQIIDFRLIAPE